MADFRQFRAIFVIEIDRDRDFAHFLYEFLSFEVVLTSEVYMTASVDVLRGQGNLKTQKFLQKWSEIARSSFCIHQQIIKYLKNNQWPRFEAALRLL